MPVTLPYDLIVPVKREIKSAELMGNYNALRDKFSAGIVDADCSANMNLNGTKLLANTMPANRIIDGSVSQTQLAANSVGTTQLIDLNVTTSKIALLAITGARLAAATIASEKLLLTVHVVAFATPALGTNSWHLQSANPSVSFAKANYDLLGVFVKNVTVEAGGGAPMGFAFANDSGANWAGSIVVQYQTTDGPSKVVSGSMVYVFLQKA
jgi:hypothetical protein